MISKINVNENKVKNTHINNSTKTKNNKSNPNFKGGIVDVVTKTIQACEKHPMLNVAVIDLTTAIGPRSIWESFTNLFAGFEAFRRESSGLIVNCLLPGFVALGAAKATNRLIMGKDVDLSSCWADSKSINTISDFYKNAKETPAFEEGMAKFNDAKKARVYATHYNMLSSGTGVDGDVVKKFNEIKDFNIAKAAEDLTTATFEETKKLSFKERMSYLFGRFKGNKPPKKVSLVDKAYKEAASQTHITNNIKIGEGTKTVATDLKSAMSNSTKLLRGFIKSGAETPAEIENIAKKGKTLLKTKGGIAMAIILPLAASMQFINRKITAKMSGVEGAPIYKDYGKNQDAVQKTPEQKKTDKKGLLKQKFISIGSMLGLACLSMMKLPTAQTFKNLLQFKGPFPTMDQARAISAVTFSSRMAAADDKNELAESTTRDLVTFGSMYFLGDYAAKGYATHVENKTGAKLLNRTKPLPKNANIFQKIGNWIVNTNLKSTDELVADSVRSLDDMKKIRTKAQAVNLGSALLILGLLVPIFTRMRTKKKHEQELLAQQNSKQMQTDVVSKNSVYGTINPVDSGLKIKPAFAAFKQQVKESK